MNAALYLIHGATLALAWFLALNLVVSAAVAAFARRVRRSPSAPFALRLLPAVASIVFVAGVFVPSYWRYEPREFTESFDLTLTVLAGAGAAILVAGFLRAVGAWWRAASRARAWTRTAVPLALAGVDLLVFRIDAAQPMMALVGILRPRLLVTSGLIDALTPEELSASLAHEAGHNRAWDNLKRLLMRGAPDLLSWTSAARTLEREWASASERNADAAAAIAGGRTARLALASALVKVARLMPAAVPLTVPICTLLGGGDVASRVQHLIDDGADAERPRKPARWFAALAAIAVSVAFGYAPLIQTVHAATEILVHRLP